MGQLPVYYSAGKQRDYMDFTSEPLYPFGYGLSYTTFEYSGLKIEKLLSSAVGMISDNGLLMDASPAVAKVTVSVKNTGNRDGSEVVQLYIHDCAASVVQPPLQLRAFEKVNLKAGESKDVTFVLGFDELSIIGRDMKRVLEAGEFEIMVGASSLDIRQKGTLEI